jgi:hypothetical protein
VKTHPVLCRCCVVTPTFPRPFTAKGGEIFFLEIENKKLTNFFLTAAAIGEARAGRCS